MRNKGAKINKNRPDINGPCSGSILDQKRKPKIYKFKRIISEDKGRFETLQRTTNRNRKNPKSHERENIMTDPIINRVSILEDEVKTFGKDIHNIRQKVGNIENDMSELKEITKNNTGANLKTNETLTDIHLTLREYRGGFKTVLWIVGAAGGLAGLMSLINSLSRLNGG